MTGWRSRTNAGVFIAASDSSAKDKAVADYVCDGTNDGVQINAALAALPATGGTVVLSDGTFVKSVTNITIPIDNVCIRGQGRSTIVKLANSVNASAQVFYASGKDSIEILDMIIDGNEANNTSGSQYGINFVSCTNLNIDCWIENCLTGDLIVNNIETCGKIKNRNYDDEYMPREKTLLVADGTTGWSVVSGTATLEASTDGSLKITIPDSGEVCIEHVMVADIRFYPLLTFCAMTPAHDTRPPTDWMKIGLEDSAGNLVETAFGFYDLFVDYPSTESRLPSGAVYGNWVACPVGANRFVWNNNYSILGDVAKIRLTLKGRGSTGTVWYLGNIMAYRGTQRPIVTFVWDDGLKGVIDYVLHVYELNGFTAVTAVNTHRVGETLGGGSPWGTEVAADSENHLTWADLEKLRLGGWDIACHSASHVKSTFVGGYWGPDVGYVSRSIWEWVACRAALEAKRLTGGAKFLLHAGSHISNYMHCWAHVGNIARDTYNSHVSPYMLGLNHITYGTFSKSALLKHHSWVVTIHHHANTAGEKAAVDTEVSYAKSCGIQVLSFSDVLRKYDINIKTSPDWAFGWSAHADHFSDLLEADTDHVHAGIVGTGSAQTITTFAAQPDYPRNVTVSCTNVETPSGAVTVYGTDARGYLLSQKLTIVAGGMASTTAAFATVTQVTVPATVTAADTITVGIGDLLGLSHWILEYTDVSSITRNGAAVTVADSLFIIKNGFVSWEATVDLSTITAGDDVVIRYRTNM